MTRADLPGVLGVVIEVLLGQQAVFITDESIAAHGGGIELHLNLHVLGDGVESAAHLLHQHFARFAEAVDVGVVAVAFVGQGFHGAILEIAAAKAEHAEEDPGLGLVLDEFFQLFG